MKIVANRESHAPLCPPSNYRRGERKRESLLVYSIVVTSLVCVGSGGDRHPHGSDKLSGRLIIANDMDK